MGMQKTNYILTAADAWTYSTRRLTALPIVVNEYTNLFTTPQLIPAGRVSITAYGSAGVVMNLEVFIGAAWRVLTTVTGGLFHVFLISDGAKYRVTSSDNAGRVLVTGAI